MEQDIRARKRVTLYGALATIVVFFAFPVLALATPALDGVVDGIGVVYLVASWRSSARRSPRSPTTAG
jgi:hypothetical protein